MYINNKKLIPKCQSNSGNGLRLAMKEALKNEAKQGRYGITPAISESTSQNNRTQNIMRTYDTQRQQGLQGDKRAQHLTTKVERLHVPSGTRNISATFPEVDNNIAGKEAAQYIMGVSKRNNSQELSNKDREALDLYERVLAANNTGQTSVYDADVYKRGQELYNQRNQQKVEEVRDALVPWVPVFGQFYMAGRAGQEASRGNYEDAARNMTFAIPGGKAYLGSAGLGWGAYDANNGNYGQAGFDIALGIAPSVASKIFRTRPAVQQRPITQQKPKYIQTDNGRIVAQINASNTENFNPNSLPLTQQQSLQHLEQEMSKFGSSNEDKLKFIDQYLGLNTDDLNSMYPGLDWNRIKAEEYNIKSAIKNNDNLSWILSEASKQPIAFDKSTIDPRVNLYYENIVWPRMRQQIKEKYPLLTPEQENELKGIFTNPYDNITVENGFMPSNWGGYSQGSNYIRYPIGDSPSTETLVHEAHHSVRDRFSKWLKNNSDVRDSMIEYDEGEFLPDIMKHLPPEGAYKLPESLKAYTESRRNNQLFSPEYSDKEVKAMEDARLQFLKDESTSDITPTSEIGATTAESTYRLWKNLPYWNVRPAGETPTLDQLMKILSGEDVYKTHKTYNLFGLKTKRPIRIPGTHIRLSKPVTTRELIYKGLTPQKLTDTWFGVNGYGSKIRQTFQDGKIPIETINNMSNLYKTIPTFLGAGYFGTQYFNNEKDSESN